MSVNTKMKAIADEIRAVTGETDPLTLDDMAENVPKVYEAGKKAESKSFWDMVTNNNTRESYEEAFRYWGSEYIRPDRKIMPTGSKSLSYTFVACRNLKKIEASSFDFSNKARGTTSADGALYTFYECNSLEEVEDIGIQAQNEYCYTFYNCKNLRKIAVIRCDENTKWSNPFFNCGWLLDLTIEGVIGKNGFTVAPCERLSKKSITSIINALSPNTSGLSVTLLKYAVNKAFSTTEGGSDGTSSQEWKDLVASKPNWTISLS